jgi:hypothetical protein
MSNLHKDLGELTPEQRELLELLLAREGVDVARTLMIPRRPDNAPAPLSAAQRRLWFTDQLAAANGFLSPNTNPAAWRLQGPLQVEALAAGLTELARRHEIIRTRFTVQQEEPVQIVAPTAVLPLPVVDLSDLQADEREAAAQRLMDEEARQPIDLTSEPLLRAKLLRLDASDHILLLTTHYVVADGMSEGILLRELSLLANAAAAGTVAPLPELPIQYADYALWQPRSLQGEERQKQMDYWKEQLRGCPERLLLATDRPRPTVPTFRGASRWFSLPAGLSPALRALAVQEGVTPYMVFLAALQTTLYCQTGQDDVVVATTISNRGRPEAEGLLGFFANNLFLRTSFASHLTLRDVLHRAAEVAIGAFGHQDLPTEDLLTELYLDPTRRGGPQVQVVFVLHDHSTEQDLALDGVTVHKLPVEKGTATFDLYLRIINEGGEFSGSLEYSTDLYDAATIDRLLADFQRMLQHFVGHRDQPVATLDLFAEAASRRPAAGAGTAITPTPTAATPRVPPRTELEQTIAAIWQEVLQREAVGAEDNFFDLGGRSLHLTLVSTRLQAALGRPIPIVKLFEFPTISAVARYLGEGEPATISVQRETSRAASRLAARARRAQLRQDHQTTPADDDEE